MSNLNWHTTSAARTLLASLDRTMFEQNKHYSVPADFYAWEPRNSASLPEAARRSALGAYERLEAIRTKHLGIGNDEFRACTDDDQRRELIARHAQAMTVSDAIGAEFDRRNSNIRSAA